MRGRGEDSVRMKPNSAISLVLMLTLCAQQQLQLAQCQRLNQPIEALKCTEYKKEFFEVRHTWSTFAADATEQVDIEDNCFALEPFIIGGRPAQPREFPHIARAGHVDDRNITDFFCGGTLISERFVLTAAHCFYTHRGILNIIRLGELDAGSDTEDARPEDFAVRRTIPHPSYDDERSWYNDIGLVWLARDVRFDSYKHPACLPTSNGDNISRLLAIGWGQTLNATSSRHLMKVGLDKINYEHCDRLTRTSDIDKLPQGINLRSQLCAGSNQSQDTCYGDSGGPLLAVHNDYQCMYLLEGITSASLGSCGVFNVPGIYTRVYNYMDWIKQYLRW